MKPWQFSVLLVALLLIAAGVWYPNYKQARARAEFAEALKGAEISRRNREHEQFVRMQEEDRQRLAEQEEEARKAAKEMAAQRRNEMITDLAPLLEKLEVLPAIKFPVDAPDMLVEVIGLQTAIKKAELSPTSPAFQHARLLHALLIPCHDALTASYEARNSTDKIRDDLDRKAREAVASFNKKWPSAYDDVRAKVAALKEGKDIPDIKQGS